MKNLNKRLEICIIRLYPFIANILELITLILVLMGYNPIYLNYIFGYSLFSTFCFYLISKNNPKYHCKWNRALYLNLMAVCTFDLLDSLFNFISVEWYVILTSVSWIVCVTYTSYRCILHFTYKR